MVRPVRGLSRQSAVRIHEAIDGGPYSKAELNRRLGVGPTFLQSISGYKARTEDSFYRPMPAADIMTELAIITNHDINYLLGYTDLISPVVQKYKREFSELVERFSDELLEQAQARVGMQGNKIELRDILQWLRDTGGVIGTGADIEEHVDVVKIPDAGEAYAAPLRVGKYTMASNLIQTTDPDAFRQSIETWPEKTQRALAHQYRQIADVSHGRSYSLTEMSLTIPDRSEPINYWSFKARVTLSGARDQTCAICFAFE